MANGPSKISSPLQPRADGGDGIVFGTCEAFSFLFRVVIIISSTFAWASGRIRGKEVKMMLISVQGSNVGQRARVATFEIAPINGVITTQITKPHRRAINFFSFQNKLLIIGFARRHIYIPANCHMHAMADRQYNVFSPYDVSSVWRRNSISKRSCPRMQVKGYM